jgi:hypothetical protein
MINKITQIAELYSAAGDESNTRTQYIKYHDEARKILINEVKPEVERLNKSIQELESAMREFIDMHGSIGDGVLIPRTFWLTKFKQLLDKK